MPVILVELGGGAACLAGDLLAIGAAAVNGPQGADEGFSVRGGVVAVAEHRHEAGRLGVDGGEVVAALQVGLAHRRQLGQRQHRAAGEGRGEPPLGRVAEGVGRGPTARSREIRAGGEQFEVTGGAFHQPQVGVAPRAAVAGTVLGEQLVGRFVVERFVIKPVDQELCRRTTAIARRDYLAVLDEIGAQVLGVEAAAPVGVVEIPRGLD